MVEIGMGFLAVRVIAHLITFLYIAKWYDGEAEHRTGVSWFAIALAGGSFSAAWLGLLVEQPLLPQFPLMLLAVALAIAVVRAEGNVAKLLPRRRWSHRP